MKISTTWGYDTGEFGKWYEKGDYDRYIAVSISAINDLLNNSGIPTNAVITSVTVTATIRAENNTSACEAKLKIGFGSNGGLSNPLLDTVTIFSWSMSGSTTRTVDLSSVIDNNGLSPFQLNTSKGTHLVWNVWIDQVGVKRYQVSDVFFDVEYTIPTYTITVGNGTVNGAPSGTFEAGTSVTLVPFTPTGYEFTEWSDGNTDNPRVVVVTGDQSYVARFKKIGPPFAEDTLIDGVLYVGTDTTNIETYLGYEGRTDIVSVIIPDGRTKIGKCVFESCTNIRDITIPTSVTDLGDGTFGNTYIGEIYYGGTKAQWSNLNIGSAFNSLSGITVYCSDGFLEYVYVDIGVSPADAGTVTIYPEGVQCAFGTYYIRDSEITFTAMPANGYQFKYWISNGEIIVASPNPFSYTVTTNDTLEAVFTFSKLYAGTSQAKAVYVGTTPAKAIYIGTTKIYEQ